MSVSSSVHSHGLPRGGIPRIQNQIQNLETSIHLEKVILADLKTRRNRLMEELASVDQNLVRTEASLERTSTSLINRIDTVDSHEHHGARMQAIQIV